MGKYVVQHLHDDTSNCNGYADSCSSYKEYIKLAKKQGMTAIAFSNHGGIYDWMKKKQDCDKAGIKYIHGIELYMCTALEADERGYHICLYAKNYEGVRELNKLISISTSKGKKDDKTDRHFYYNPRISLQELMNTSENILVTSACLASILWCLSNKEILNEENGEEKYKNNLNIRNIFLEWLSKNNSRCFLEIQYHNNEHQKKFNQMLWDWSKQYDIKLIAGTDTHSSSKYKAECRKILQISKDSFYGEEDEFDLVWKTYDELVECFRIQNSIPEEVWIEAIENTNKFADMVEDFKLDKSFKYPNLYGKDALETWKQTINKKLNYKAKNKIIDISRLNDYKTKIKEEFIAMKKQNMESFMMFMSELVDYCIANNIPYGFCRGSVGGSEIAYITDVTDVDPIVWNTVFSRFCNSDRISLADIDIDFAPEDRVKVYEFIINKFTPEKTAYIAAFSTLKDRGTIDVLAKGLNYEDLDVVMNIKNSFDKLFDEYFKIIQEEVNIEELEVLEAKSIDFDYHDVYTSRIRNNKALTRANNLKKDFQLLKDNNKDIFYYFDGLKNTIIAKGVHPAGIIGSPITLADNLGVFYKDGDESQPVSVCAMKAVDSVNFVKFDILGLKTVGIMKDVYKYIGSHYLKAHEINWNDDRVWDNMITSNVGVFQFEGDYAFSLLKDFKPRFINDMSLINAALRPSGKSYRDRLIRKEFNMNPSDEINILLKDNYGYLVYQEDTIKFLTDICGFDGSTADTTRRCVDENTLVTMGNGNLKKIKDISINERVMSVNSNGVSESKIVKNVFNNGIKDVFKVTTIHGKELIATSDHKVFTQDGYKLISNLNTDDSIMSIRKINSDNENNFKINSTDFGISDVKAKEISKELYIPYTYWLLNTDYIPLRVKSIEYVGQSNVYDIEVEDNHNYIANGLVVHNCIGKKDLVGLQQQLPKILEGYCKVSSQPREIAEEEAKQFIQIIDDSSEYQFGYNHSTGYSMNGYAETRLRTYYPLEFVTAYLNRAETTEDINNGIELAKQLNIEVKPISFGNSVAEYTFDRETNTVYKGISSIKYLNEQVPTELLELSKQKKYNNFVDLLGDIQKTSVDSRQLKILTGLNFFRKFGNNKKLLQIIKIYDDLAYRKQINFKDIEKLNINENLLKSYSKKTTASLYKELDMLSYIKVVIDDIEDKPLSVKEQVKFEMEYLEYVDYTNDKASDNFYIIIEYKTYSDKTKPYITLHNIKTGKKIKTKIKDGKIFTENPFKLYDVLKVIEFKQQFKTKNIGGEWKKTDELEDILYNYEVY